MYLSIVIPVWNEQDSLVPLHEKLVQVLNPLRKPYEIIFIDDGSRDRTPQILKGLAKKDRHVKVVTFRKNFGKSAALNNGFQAATGGFIITMDGDLQDEPSEIPKFLEKIQDADLVTGWKVKRHDPLTKRIPSKIFNRLTAKLTGVDIHDSNCCFKIYRSEVAKSMNLYGEMHRFVPALAHWKGFRVTEIPVQHNPRLYGKSKYGIGRLVKGFLDLLSVRFLMSYTKRPMHLFGFIGFFLFWVGLVISAYLAYLQVFLSQHIGERPLLLLGVMLLVLGVQFISMGLLGELIINLNSNKESDLGMVKNEKIQDA